MKKIKITAIALAVVLVIGGVVGGTLSYLTDSDGDINVMTVGNINIELHELQREFDANNQPIGLVDFEQSKTLLPIVGSAQGTKDAYGMPIAANFVDKIAYVENTGKNDAYVRVLVAVPQALLDFNRNGSGDSSDDALHVSLGNRVDVTGAGQYNTSDWKIHWTWDWQKANATEVKGITIDGIDYSVLTYNLPEVLEPGQTTYPVIAGVYLDSSVDYDNDTDTWIMGSHVIDFDLTQGVKIPVLAQAVQADGFDTPDAAFEASFRSVNASNNPWAKVVTVDNEIDLKTALATDGNVVTLAADIALTSNLKIENNVTLDGNGFAFTGDYVVQVDEDVKSLVIEDLTFDNAKAGQQSSIYAQGEFAGLLSIVDCEFTGAAWDCIQVTPVEGAKIVIKENTFTAGIAGERFVHVQATQGAGEDIKVTVENNVFNDPANLRNSAVDIDYVVKSGIKVGGNKVTNFEDGDLYICDVNDMNIIYTDLVEDFTK